ncbi:MAG: DUF1343 domain-containing protein [Bacteroidales bacterium]
MKIFTGGLCMLMVFSAAMASCNFSPGPELHNDQGGKKIRRIIPAAERTAEYFSMVSGKTVALVANPGSRSGGVHLLDTLLSAGIRVDRVLAPEHGFRGEAEAGEHVDGGVDEKTGVKVVSLYGRNRKPSSEDLKGIDLVIFDIQDVGVRFYTYLSTMHYVMDKCAEMDIEFMVLDRPNPNGFYIDGPVLDTKYSSFVGLHEVPLVHGMTPGEFALMIEGEGWLTGGRKLELKVITVENYTHNRYYDLPVAPSPNLPNMKSVYLYPSLGLFEGTIMSIGRGTDMPFQVVGHPGLKQRDIAFTPRSIPGASKNPKHKGEICHGWDLRDTALALREQKEIHLSWLIDSYEQLKKDYSYFNHFFYKLSGNNTLRKKIEAGWTEEKIRQSWEKDIEDFKKIRKRYLLYPDFE